MSLIRKIFLATALAGALIGKAKADEVKTPVYLEQFYNSQIQDGTTRIHLGDKRLQLSHTESGSDKIAAKQPFNFQFGPYALESTVSAYGEKSLKSSGIGFDLTGRVNKNFVVGLTAEDNGQELLNARLGYDNNITAEAGIVKKGNASLYQALFGAQPTRTSWVGTSFLVDRNGEGKYNFGAAVFPEQKGQGFGARIHGSDDGHGNGFAYAQFATSATFGKLAPKGAVQIEDKGFADASIVDNIADFRPPFSHKRGQTTLGFKEVYGAKGDQHSVEATHTVTRGDLSLNFGLAASWKDGNLADKVITPNIGADYKGWTVQSFTDIQKDKEPVYTLWFWKEWKF